MAHYFFDTLCGTEFRRDVEGLYFSRLSEAVQQAKRSLGELARDCVPKIDHGTMAMWVRDGEDQVLCTASLQLEITRRPF